MAAELRAAGAFDRAVWTPQTPAAAGYAPTRVVLLLTTKCNLRCGYCYAYDGNPVPRTIPLPVGRAAIDFAANNCVARQAPALSLAFHGGGEPTQAWRECVALVGHAETAARQQGLRLEVGLATNGNMSAERAAWVARHATHVNVSMDGPPDVQDRQRPTRAGAGSSKALLRFLRALDNTGVSYGIQATVTAATVGRLTEIVRYVALNTKAKILKFEPACRCGRFADRACDIPAAGDFVEAFNAAFDEGWRLGIGVAFSGVRILAGAVSTFCGAFGEPFCVTPDGDVSACFEVFAADSPYLAGFTTSRAGSKKH